MTSTHCNRNRPVGGRIGLVAVIAAAAGVLWASGRFAGVGVTHAQYESAEGVTFAFRDADGRVTWLARAQTAVLRDDAPHPDEPDRRMPAWVFAGSGSGGSPTDDPRGVEVRLPADGAQPVAAGRDPGAAIQDLPVVVIAAARLRYYKFPRAAGSRAVREVIVADDAVVDIPTGDGVVTVSSGSLRIDWQPQPRPDADFPPGEIAARPPRSTRRVTITAADTVRVNAPAAGLVIEQCRRVATSLDDPDGRLRIGGPITGRLAAGARFGATVTDALSPQPAGLPRTTTTSADTGGDPSPGLGLRTGGDADLDFGPRFRSSQPRRIELRGTVTLTDADGRSLRCNRLLVEPARETAEGPSPSQLSADGNVDLKDPGILRVRCTALTATSDPLQPGDVGRSTLQIRGVRDLRVYALGAASGPEFAGAAFGSPTTDGAPSPTRIDAMAEGLIRLTRVRREIPDDEGRLGSDMWELIDGAQLEQWRAESAPAARRRRADPARPDFGVYDRMTGGSRRDGAGGRSFRPDSDFTRVAILRGGSARPADAGADSTAGVGRIRIAIDVQPPRELRPNTDATPRSRLRRIEVVNHSVRPIAEFIAPRATLRLFGDRLDGDRQPTVGGRFDEVLTLAADDGERPVSITVITPDEPEQALLRLRDRGAAEPREADPLDAGGGADAPTWRYTLRGDRQMRIRRTVDAAGRVVDLDWEIPGRVRVDKVPFANVPRYDPRRDVAVIGRDLRFGAVAQPSGELTPIRADLAGIAQPAGPGGGSTAEIPAPPAQLRVDLGLDSLTAARVQWRRTDAVSGDAGSVTPVRPTRENLTLDGPVRITLRDPRSCRFVPIADVRGRPQPTARVDLAVRGSIAIDALRPAESGAATDDVVPELRLTAAGGLDLAAWPFTNSPAAAHRLAHEVIASAAAGGNTLRAVGRLPVAAAQALDEPAERPARDADPLDRGTDRPFPSLRIAGGHLVALWQDADAEPTGTTPVGLAGPMPRWLVLTDDVSIATEAYAARLGGDRLTIDARARDNPADPRLPPVIEISGSPGASFEVSDRSGMRRHVTLAFAPTDDPLLQTQRAITIDGLDPRRIRVQHRSTLSFAAAREVDDYRLTADRMTLSLASDAAARPDAASRRRDAPPAGSFADLPLDIVTLTAGGDVAIAWGRRALTGDRFVWQRDDGMTARLWGAPVGVSAAGEAVSIDFLRRQSPTAAGTLWTYTDRDPEHPERRNVISARSSSPTTVRVERDDESAPDGDGK
jgi:hypothetical protein